jgi:drug/metabolite transporter (DMT)-like permease
MLWLIVAILSYFFFSLASLGDRYLLIGPPKPKVYAFYVGSLGVSALLLLPFINFSLPGFNVIILSFITGVIFLLSLIFLFYGLERFEVSRIVPALGGFLPIFTLIFGFLILNQQESFYWQKILSFCLLIMGSIIISLEKSFNFSFKSLFFAALAALFLSLYFVFSKVVYFYVSFWEGFIFVRVGAFLATLFLLFFKEVRKEVFSSNRSFTKKTGFIFLLTQSAGGLAVIMQNWAIALVNSGFISFISAVQGVQYVFLFILTLIVSLISPKILKERISKRIILQKLAAIVLITAGLAALVF